MDAIFQKTRNIFTVVKTAKDEPNRYDKEGNLLIKYEDTDVARRASGTGRRRSSVAYGEKMGSSQHV